MTRPMIFAVILTALACNHSPLRAQQESRSWWPKFSSDDGKSSSSSTSRSGSNASKNTSDAAWWQPWKFNNKPAAKSSKPNGSVVSRMGKTTKKWWNNSLDFVNPFNDAPKPKPQNGYTPQNNTKKTGGGIFGWMAPQEEERIDSINKFLALPMPE